MTTFQQIRNPLILFFSIRLLLATGERMFSPFLPTIARGLNIEVTQVTLALSLSFMASAISPFLAAISDRYGRKPVILSGLALFTSGCLLLATTPYYAAFLLSVLVMGVAHSLIIPTILAYMSDRISYQNRGLYLSLVETSWAFSYIIGIPVMAFFVENYGWRLPFGLLAAGNIVLFFCVIWLVPEDHTFFLSHNPYFSHIGNLTRSIPALAGLLIAFVFGISEHSINIVMGIWMEDGFMLSILAIGGVASLVGISQLSGELVAAFGVDRVGKRRLSRLALLLNIVILLQIFWMSKSLTGAITWLFFAFFSFELFFVCSLSLISEILPESRTTMAASYTTCIAFGFAAGTYLGPYLYPFGIEIVAITSAFFSAIALLIFWLFLSPKLPSDLAVVLKMD
jgi:MFS transporter, DHA1 family, multidrug resistance protein